MKNEYCWEVDKALQENPLVLAFVGDAVMTLFVRTNFSKLGVKVNKLNKLTNEKVNAKAQADLFLKIEKELTQQERDLAQRARNTNMHHKAKNFLIMEYRYATALEAVIGFLYLTGQEERLNKILEECL